MSYRKLLFLLLLTIPCYPAKATHIVGGEMTYVCTGADGNGNNNNYIVTLNLYQDCYNGSPNAIADDDPAILAIYTDNNLLEKMDSVWLRESIGVPPNFSNDCINNPPYVCLRKASFVYNVSLPRNRKHTIVYQRCCRNGTIVNILNPGSIGATYTCTIPVDPATLCNNNSAVFKNYPPQIICINNPLIYDHSATDPDGDSLSYEFCEAFQGGEPRRPKPLASPPPYPSVDYSGPYDYDRPMLGSPLVQIDPVTGIIGGTPNIVGRFVVAVCCHEWRNGVMINTVTREFQFVVTNCSKAVVANMPQYSDEFNTYIVECQSRTVKFNNTSVGGFDYHWDFGIPGISSDTSNEFAPAFTYPDTGTYRVSLIVNKGSTCTDSISKLVKIYPFFIADFGFNGIPCPNAPVSFFDSSKATVGPIVKWNWYFGDWTFSYAAESLTVNVANPVHYFIEGGNYKVKLIARTIKGCVDTAYKNVMIEHFKPDAGNDTIIVKGEQINFKVSGGETYQWIPPTYLNNPSIGNPTGYYPDTGTIKYTVNVTSVSGCVGSDSIKVRVVENAFVFVPNAFTPNGDGKNDRFHPLNVGYKSFVFFRVFDRWGQNVFFSDNYEASWDGVSNGVPAALGTYYWELKMINRFGNDEFYKGDVILLR